MHFNNMYPSLSEKKICIPQIFSLILYNQIKGNYTKSCTLSAMKYKFFFLRE